MDKTITIEDHGKEIKSQLIMSLREDPRRGETYTLIRYAWSRGKHLYEVQVERIESLKKLCLVRMRPATSPFWGTPDKNGRTVVRFMFEDDKGGPWRYFEFQSREKAELLYKFLAQFVEIGEGK